VKTGSTSIVQRLVNHLTGLYGMASNGYVTVTTNIL